MEGWMAHFNAKGGYKGRDRLLATPQETAPPPPPAANKEHDKKKSHKKKKPQPKRVRRPVEEEDEEEEDEEEDGYDDEDDDYYEPRRKKVKTIRRVRAPPPPYADRNMKIKRVVKKGSGNDFLEYGKAFTKAFSRVPDDVRPDLVQHVRPPLMRGYRTFIHTLLTDPNIRQHLTDNEKTALFENGRERLLYELAERKSNPFNPMYKDINRVLIPLIQDFQTDSAPVKKQPPPRKAPVQKQQPVSTSEDDDDDEEDDEETVADDI